MQAVDINPSMSMSMAGTGTWTTGSRGKCSTTTKTMQMQMQPPSSLCVIVSNTSTTGRTSSIPLHGSSNSNSISQQLQQQQKKHQGACRTRRRTRTRTIWTKKERSRPIPTNTTWPSVQVDYVVHVDNDDNNNEKQADDKDEYQHAQDFLRDFRWRSAWKELHVIPEETDDCDDCDANETDNSEGVSVSDLTHHDNHYDNDNHYDYDYDNHDRNPTNPGRARLTITKKNAVACFTDLLACGHCHDDVQLQEDPMERQHVRPIQQQQQQERTEDKTQVLAMRSLSPTQTFLLDRSTPASTNTDDDWGQFFVESTESPWAKQQPSQELSPTFSSCPSHRNDAASVHISSSHRARSIKRFSWHYHHPTDNFHSSNSSTVSVLSR